MNVGGSSSSSSHPLAPFTPLRKLGAGGFGSVFLVRDSRDGIQYVMKEVELTKLDAKGRRDAMKEVKFLARMSHPNIIGYKEWFQLASPPIMQHYVGPSAGRGMRWPPPLPVSNAPSRPGTTCTLYIVMTYADGGDLESRIKAQQALSGSARHGGRFVPFPEQQIIDWFIQTALAIKHVHDRKILHRDIKTQNIFLTKLQLVKLGDFGIARDLSNTLAKAMTQIGTPFYLSPEICNEQPYDAKSDMWALGVVLYELLTLRHPFSGSTMKQLLSNIVQARYPPVPALYSKPLVELVGYLLQKNPKNRPSINQLLRMPFIQTHIGRFLNAHQIQEEFSHSILHGPSSNHAALQQGAAARRAPPASAGAARPSADAKAHALAAQQQQQQQQQQAAAAAAALAAKEAADRVVREQQQREQQAREVARQAAIRKAKQQALEAAERARAQQRELIHKQQMAQAAARARLEAAHAEKQRKEREELERLRQAREAIQKERQQRFEKAQADRQEAARRAEERAKQVAAEREEDRRRDKEARDLRRAAAQVAGAGAGAAGGGGGGGWDAPCVVVAAPKRGRQQPPRSSMDNRPPWVGVMDESEIEAAKRVADEQAEEQRRKRELEAEQRGHAPNYHHPPQRASYDPSIAPTIVRPRPPSFHRQLQMEQQQQQQQQQHQQHQHGGHHPAQRRAASVADLAPAHADRNGHAAGAAAAGGSHNRQLSKAEAQRLHEEKLAQARKEYFEERKRLERMQRERVQAELGGASGAGSEGTSSAAPDNRASSLPAAAPAPHRPSPLQRTQSEATFDRPHAPHQRQPTPSTSRSSSSSSSSHAPSSKAEAQAAKEAELARIRQEYFLERKALAERKKRMLMMEENGLNDATQASPAQSPIADQPASRSRSPLALHDRTPRAPAQRTVRESILSSSPEVTALLSDGEQADHDQALEMGSSTVRHVPRGSGDDFEVVHAQPSARASPRDDPEVDGVEGEDESEEDKSEAEAEMVSIDPEFAASEAEATIDELARSNESCLEMIQLMQTMRHAHAMSTSLSGKKKQQEKDGQEANGADDQIPVQTVIHQPSRDHDQDGDEYVEEEADDDSMSEVHEDEEEEYQIPLARSDDDVDEEGEQEGEGDEEEEEEESALAEYTAVFQSQHVREAAAIARRQLAEEEEERRVRQNTTTNSKPNSIDDHPQEEHAVLSPPSGQTILYNSSATPSAVHRDESRPPTTAATNTVAPSTTASPALSSRSTISTASSVSSSSTSSSSSSSSNPTPSRNGSDQSSASSRSSSGAASSSSISFAECADPLSYKVESLRLFLGQKIGDTLLMQIWDLLRAKLSSPSTSVAGGDDGLAQSPLQISVHVENAHVATLPSSAAASTGVAPRSRSSMTSLIINGMNVRALLTESGLLSAGGNHSKYLSLIQQLIQAEYELYGQL